MDNKDRLKAIHWSIWTLFLIILIWIWGIIFILSDIEKKVIQIEQKLEIKDGK